MNGRNENILLNAGFPVYLHGFSAIDSYLSRTPTHGGLGNHEQSGALYVLCMADLADLARLFDKLRYPGAAFADAALDCGEKTWYFRCADSGSALRDYRSSFIFLEFYQDCKTRRFYDPHDIYPYIRYLKSGAGTAGRSKKNDSALLHSCVKQNIKTAHAGADPVRALLDGAMILSRYFPGISIGEINAFAAGFIQPGQISTVSIEEQRLALLGLLQAANPAAGFELLKNCDFVSEYWPELAALDNVDHSKEYHPEGNVWKHTMEALRYRKSGNGGFDLRLSLGLLLHDVGKPLSNSTGSRRFDGHAELGEHRTRRFLERLGFNAVLVHDICYLVRNHMLPAALPRLPLTRTGEIMSSPLFPLLMELYRCDESSSFKGLEGYYRSSAAYQAYLKNRRNPYRSADGKKLNVLAPCFQQLHR